MNFKSSMYADGDIIKWSPSNFINSILMEYEFNKYPRAYINLTLEGNKWINYKELSVSIELDDFQTDFILGIDGVSKTKTSEVVFQGYLAPLDAFAKVYSRYLGSNPEGAIKTLGFKQDLDINKVDNDYFQINETSISSLDKILLGNVYQGLYFIDEKYIKVKSISSINSTQNYKTLIKTPISLNCDSQFSAKERPSESSYKITTVSDEKNFELSLYSQYGVNLISPSKCQYDLNAVSNYIYRNGLSMALSDTYDKIYDINIGDVVGIPTKEIDERKFLVTKLKRLFTRNGMSSSIEIQR